MTSFQFNRHLLVCNTVCQIHPLSPYTAKFTCNFINIRSVFFNSSFILKLFSFYFCSFGFFFFRCIIINILLCVLIVCILLLQIQGITSQIGHILILLFKFIINLTVGLIFFFQIVENAFYFIQYICHIFSLTAFKRESTPKPFFFHIRIGYIFEIIRLFKFRQYIIINSLL